MKKTLAALAAMALFTTTMPALAMDASHHHAVTDQTCMNDCDRLLKNCATEVDTIQQHIQKLQTAITANADRYTPAELNKLKRNLADAQMTMDNLLHR